MPATERHREVLEAAWTMAMVDGERAEAESQVLAGLAARLGVSPVATVSRWLANPRNEPLRLVLADGLAATEDPAARRARLPRALRCWIPRWPRTAASPAMPLPLRLVGAAPAAAVGSDWVGGLDPIKR